jgi:hypothetical protein
LTEHGLTVSLPCMSVGAWHKLSLVQTVKAADGSVSNFKLGSVTLSPTVAAQLQGSTIEFEFVKVEPDQPTAESLTKILIGL